MKLDMHCHTKEGSPDGKVPVEEMIDILIEKGYDGMLVSDHDSYNGYRAWLRNPVCQRKPDFTVLKGIEYDTIDAGHILVIMPEDVKLPILELRGLPVQFLIKIVHKHGGILGPAHPCGVKFMSIFNTRKHRGRPEIMEQFDFIEGFNACEEPESNDRAQEIAAEYGKPAFGGSDAHKLDCIGLGATEFAGEVASESDLIALVKEMGAQACTCGGSYYQHTTKQKIGRLNSVLVHSFWLYNHVGSMWRYRRRHLELKRMYIRIR